MRYSTYLGITGCLLVIAGSWLPWVTIEPLGLTISGMNPGRSNYGRGGLLHIFLSSVSLLFFLVPRVWAKRANTFFAAFALAWGIRNYLIYARCELGTCPVRQYGLYMVFGGCLLAFAASLLPGIRIKQTVLTNEKAED